MYPTSTPTPVPPSSGAFRFLPTSKSRASQHPTVPPTRRVLVDGQRALAVGLVGEMAAGLECLIDPDTWDSVREIAGSRWFLNGPDAARAYVATSTPAARAAAATKSTNVAVARLIAGKGEALTGKLVVTLNGSRLDLRRANLMVVPRSMGEQFRGSLPLPTVTEGWE